MSGEEKRSEQAKSTTGEAWAVAFLVVAIVLICSATCFAAFWTVMTK